MTDSRVNVWLAIGDRICLWLLVCGFAGAFIYFAIDAERHSPPTLDPTIQTCRIVK